MQELAEHGKVELRNGIVMHVGHHNETSFSLRPSPDNQPDPGPVEQQEADPKKDDGQVLPPHERRSGPANYQRFSFFHGKTDEASVDEGTSANAGTEADKPSATAAKGSTRRRRALHARKRDSVGQAAEPSETSASSSERHESNASFATRAVDMFLRNSGKLFVSALALSAGFGFVRNSGLLGGVSFRGRGNEQPLQNTQHSAQNIQHFLQDAQHAVLERFGSYIPADTRCYQARVEVAEGLLPRLGGYDLGGYDLGRYDPKSNSLQFSSHANLHAAVHEYCHCFTHPQFAKALLQGTPSSEEIEESLTEYIADKMPAQGLLSNRVYETRTVYDRLKLSNGKKMTQAAQELEEAVGEATLMRAYFGGDAAAIRKISRAAVNIYPKRVTFNAWVAAGTVGGEKDMLKLAECCVGASLLTEGKLPDYYKSISIAGLGVSVRDFFSTMNSEQQEALLKQAKQARDRLGAKFDQALYNFDKKAAEQAMRNVRKDLLANWKPVMIENTKHYG